MGARVIVDPALDLTGWDCRLHGLCDPQSVLSGPACHFHALRSSLIIALRLVSLQLAACDRAGA